MVFFALHSQTFFFWTLHSQTHHYFRIRSHEIATLGFSYFQDQLSLHVSNMIIITRAHMLNLTGTWSFEGLEFDFVAKMTR